MSGSLDLLFFDERDFRSFEAFFGEREFSADSLSLPVFFDPLDFVE